MSIILAKILRDRFAVLGATVIVIFLVLAVLAPYIAPHDPFTQNLRNTLSGPRATHPLGTDLLGRDVLSRLLYGARVSLTIGAVVVGSASVIGSTLGVLAGYFGGKIDTLVSRLTDVVLVFPGIILAMAIAGMLGPGLINTMLALVATGWPAYCRLMRGQVLAAKQRGFVEAARAAGANDFRIIWYHILPNSIAPVVVMATMGMGGVILSAAALNFLGLGAQHPTPDWGVMINEGRALFSKAPHLSIYPGLAILMVVLGFNLLGDGLRDALDPRNSAERVMWR